MADDDELCNGRSDDFSDEEQEITPKILQISKKTSAHADNGEPETPHLR